MAAPFLGTATFRGGQTASSGPTRSTAVSSPEPKHATVHSSSQVQVECTVKQSSKRFLGLFFAFALLFAVHVVASFAAWSFAPGNVVPHAQQDYGFLQRVAWPVFSFPTFYLVPGPVATTSFGLLLILNSLIVAAAVVTIVMVARRRRT